MEEIINGIPVVITRKNIKTLRITVSAKGIVKVSAPYLLSTEIIKKFVTSKTDWILDRQKRFKEMSSRQNEYKQGGLVSLWGKQYPLHINKGQKTRLELIEEQFIFTQKDIINEERFTLILERFYRQQLQNRISERLPLFEELTGLRCSGWNIRKTVSRWGSCNTKTKAICFSSNLAKYSYECLDYVILHELLHIAVPNHGTNFKTMLSQYCPNWKSIRKQLNS